jgi:hypothetical protein
MSYDWTEVNRQNMKRLIETWKLLGELKVAVENANTWFKKTVTEVGTATLDESATLATDQVEQMREEVADAMLRVLKFQGKVDSHDQRVESCILDPRPATGAYHADSTVFNPPPDTGHLVLFRCVNCTGQVAMPLDWQRYKCPRCDGQLTFTEAG